MGSTSRMRLGVTAAVAGLGLAVAIAGAAPPVQPLAASGCPTGDVPGEQDRWQCVHECPGGMLYDGQTGEWVDAFELYYDQGDTFYSAWQGRSTYLDCGYYDYLVDFTPEDTAGPGEVYTIDLY